MVLCSAKLRHQLGVIQSLAWPFSMQCVRLVRLDPIERRTHMPLLGFNSLPETRVSWVIFDIIFLNMSPRRPTLLICSGISNPAGLIITPFLMRAELNTTLSCVHRSYRTSLGQKTRRDQSQMNACRRVQSDFLSTQYLNVCNSYTNGNQSREAHID